jgi:hypothetical protein
MREQMVQRLQDQIRRRRDLFQQYPVPAGKTRIELELWHPCRTLDSLPFAWNPHHDIWGGEPATLSAWSPVYSDPAWSTVFEVVEVENALGSINLDLFAEHGHAEPWGEPLRLMSTSNEFEDQAANRSAYFRGLYWAVVSPIFHYQHESRFETVDLAIDDLRHNDIGFDALDALLEAREDELVTLVGNNRVWNNLPLHHKRERKYKIDWASNGF